MLVDADNHSSLTPLIKNEKSRHGTKDLGRDGIEL